MFHYRSNQESARSSSFDLELLRGDQNSHDHRYHHPPKRSIPDCGREEKIQWFLFQKTGTISFRLSAHYPIVIGREKCDIIVDSPTVEKRHAVLAFEPNSNCFSVRDLNTTNGTYLNNRRISADHPETLSNLDLLRFGYDPTLYQVRSASLTTAGIPKVGGRIPGRGSFSASSSPYKTAKDVLYLEEQVPQRDNNNERVPSKSSSYSVNNSSLPKSLVTVTKSDPGRNPDSEGLREERKSSGVGFHGSPGVFLESHRLRSDRFSAPQQNVMHQSGRGGSISGTSRVCSPSLTLDSGRGSSSAPSSPAKEMSPVQMSGGTGCGSTLQGASSIGTSSNSQSASPVFARKHSRPMEYLLGQQSDPQEGVFVPDSCTEIGNSKVDGMTSLSVNSGHSSGNFQGYPSEPNSYNSANYNQNFENNNNDHAPFSGNGDCEILQITEDYEVGGPVRKDSLEDENGGIGNNCDSGIMMSGRGDPDVMVINGDIVGDGINSSDVSQVQPQFLVGGDIMQADLTVPNEVFGPLSHAEILNRNLSTNNNFNQSDPNKQGTKPADTFQPPHTRARSSSGDGGSNRSTPMSALYGTPHWWPESPPPEDSCCPPPPAPSSNSSPMKKSFLLNNSTYLTNSAAARLKGNSSNSSLTDPVKDLSLESAHSHRSTRTSSSSPVPATGGGVEEVTMEVKKLSPMAFTIDFGDSEPNSGVTEAAEAKKAAIAERLSKFAPRPKRTTSGGKSDDIPTKEGELLPSKELFSKPVRTTNSLGRSHHPRQSSVGNGTAESSTATSRTGSLPKKLSGTKHPSGGSSSTNNNDSGLRSLSPETISSTTSSSSRSRPLLETTNKNTTPKLTSRDNIISAMTNKSKLLQQQPPSSKSGVSGGSVTKRVTSSQQQQGTQPSVGRNYNYHRSNVDKSDKIVTPLNDLSKESTPAMNVAIVAPVDKEDTVSETGTYTVEKEVPEVESARENIEQVFGLATTENPDELEKENNLGGDNKTFCAEPGTRDWVREWAELAAQQHQQKQRPELPETQYFLRETETLVTAIQERVSKHMKSSGGTGSLRDASDSEDEPTLSHSPVKPLSQHSTPTNTKKRPPSRSSPFHRESSVLSDSGYAIGYQSDSSNEGSRDLSHGIGIKMNRALNIRRGRLVGYNSDGYASQQLLMMNQQSMTIPLNNARGVSPKAQMNNNKYNNVNVVSGSRCGVTGASASVNSTSAPLFARNDGGRFSLRMSKSQTPPTQMPPPLPKHTPISTGVESERARVMNGNKSDSHSSSQIASKKATTPSGKVMNGNGPGGKKPGNRSNSTLTAKEVEMANWKRRKNYDPMKAAADGKKTKKNTSGTESGVEEVVQLPPISSPKVNRREAMMTKSLSFHQESYSPKCVSEDEDMIYIVDEMDSSHSNSPNHLGLTRSYHEDVMYYGMPSAPIRQKNKLEALDNLVIATIHSLSNKVRTSSRQLLEKLQVQHANDENGALLEEMVSQLKELEGPSHNASPNKSPSRELSGTLKNLKKLEQVILVLDKVLCDEFESDVNG